MGFVDGLNATQSIIEASGKSNENVHLEKLIAEIFSTDNIGIRSDLTKDQVLVFAKAQLYATKFNVSIIDMLLDNYMTLALSKNRSSRKELVDISKSLGTKENDESITDKILGK